MERPKQYIPGVDIRFFMRVNGITIRQFAQYWNITLKRIRFVREHGVSGISCTDWMDGISKLAALNT